MKENQISIIAAMDQQYALEAWNNIHEYFSTVEEHLKELTCDGLVIINQATYELIKEIDLFEHYIVVTDDVLENDDKVAFVSPSYADAIAMAQANRHDYPNDEIFILGDEETFRETMDAIEKIHVVLINTTFDHELAKAPSLVNWSIDYDYGFITNDIEEDNIYGTTLFTLVPDEEAHFIELTSDQDIKMTLWMMREMHDSNLIIDYDHEEDTILYQFKGKELKPGDFLVYSKKGVVAVDADLLEEALENIDSNINVEKMLNF